MSMGSAPAAESGIQTIRQLLKLPRVEAVLPQAAARRVPGQEAAHRKLTGLGTAAPAAAHRKLTGPGTAAPAVPKAQAGMKAYIVTAGTMIQNLPPAQRRADGSGYAEPAERKKRSESTKNRLTVTARK